MIMQTILDLINAAFDAWKLDDVLHLLETESDSLSDKEYSRLYDRYLDCRDALDALSQLQASLLARDFEQIAQAYEDVNNYAALLGTYREYQKALENFQRFKTENQSEKIQKIFNEAAAFLERDIPSLEKASYLLGQIEFFDPQIVNLYRNELEELEHRLEKAQSNSALIKKIDRSIQAEYFDLAGSLISDALAENIQDTRLNSWKQTVSDNLLRLQGESITVLNNSELSKVDRLEHAVRSAQLHEEYRLAHNIAYFGYNTSDDQIIADGFLSEATKFREKFIDKLSVKVSAYIKDIERNLSVGNYQEAQEDLNWLPLLGQSPYSADDNLPGQIPDQLGDIRIVDLKDGKELDENVHRLEQIVVEAIGNREKAKVCLLNAQLEAQTNTLEDVRQSILLLQKALELDPKYREASDFLVEQKKKYEARAIKFAKDRWLACKNAIETGRFSKAERIIGDFRIFCEQLVEVPVSAIPVLELEGQIAKFSSELSSARQRADKADEIKTNLMQAFEDARNFLRLDKRTAVEALLQKWEGLTPRSNDAKRVRHQISDFFDERLPRILDLCNNLQAVKASAPFHEYEKMEKVADELERETHNPKLIRPQQALENFHVAYANSAVANGRLDAALEHFYTAKEHARILSQLSSLDFDDRKYSQQIQDLKEKIGNAAEVIDFIHLLQADFDAGNFSLVKGLIDDLPEETKQDKRIQLWLKKAETALNQASHDELINLANEILKKEPENRDYKAVENLANQALALIKTSAQAARLYQQALFGQNQESAFIKNLQELIEGGDYPRANLLASEQKSFGGKLLWSECKNIQQGYKQWEDSKKYTWEQAKEGAVHIVQYEVELVGELDAKFNTALSILNNCKSEFWVPDDFLEATSKIVEKPRAAVGQLIVKYGEAKDAFSAGKIIDARNVMNSLPSGIPEKLQKESDENLKRLNALVVSYDKIRTSLASAKKNLLSLLRNNLVSNTIDYEKINQIEDDLVSARDTASTFSADFSNYEKLYLTLEQVAQYPETSKNDQSLMPDSLLFETPKLANLYKDLCNQYAYLQLLTDWIRRKLVVDVREIQYDKLLQEQKELHKKCPGSISELKSGLDALEAWIKARRRTHEKIEEAKKISLSPSWMPPFYTNPLHEGLSILEKLDGKRLEYDDTLSAYKVSETDTPSIKENLKQNPLTDWEQDSVEIERERIKKKLEYVRRRTIGYAFQLMLAFFFCFTLVYVGARTYNAAMLAMGIITPSSTPSLTPTSSPTSTFTPSPVPPTPTPTNTLMPTPLPVLSGVMLFQEYVLRVPSSTIIAPIGAPTWLKAGDYMRIARYCEDDSGITWLLILFDDHYAWVKLKTDSGTNLVSVEGNADMPEFKLPYELKVNCPGLHTPVPGVPTPAVNGGLP